MMPRILANSLSDTLGFTDASISYVFSKWDGKRKKATTKGKVHQHKEDWDARRTMNRTSCTTLGVEFYEATGNDRKISTDRTGHPDRQLSRQGGHAGY
jgi:hypothetical protein